MIRAPRIFAHDSLLFATALLAGPLVSIGLACLIDTPAPSACHGLTPPSVSCGQAPCNTYICTAFLIQDDQCTDVTGATAGLSSSEAYTAVCRYRYRDCGSTCGSCVISDVTFTSTKQCKASIGSSCPPSGGGGPPGEILPEE